MNWTEFDLDLPRGIMVYQGSNIEIPLKAWVAKKSENGSRLIIGQHGGYYGIGLWSFLDFYEKA